MKVTVANFWDFVDASGGPDDCWPWTRLQFQSTGYGLVTLDGKNQGAHRVAYRLAKGAIGPGLVVRHTCDNRPCCNPSHLVLGTKGDNAADAVAKDRHTRGERHGLAKLTEEAVISIRSRYKKGSRDASLSVLANEFGVSDQLVHMVVTGKAWAHLPLHCN